MPADIEDFVQVDLLVGGDPAPVGGGGGDPGPGPETFRVVIGADLVKVNSTDQVTVH